MLFTLFPTCGKGFEFDVFGFSGLSDGWNFAEEEVGTVLPHFAQKAHFIDEILLIDVPLKAVCALLE